MRRIYFQQIKIMFLNTRIQLCSLTNTDKISQRIIRLHTKYVSMRKIWNLFCNSIKQSQYTLVPYFCHSTPFLDSVFSLACTINSCSNRYFLSSKPRQKSRRYGNYMAIIDSNIPHSQNFQVIIQQKSNINKIKYL